MKVRPSANLSHPEVWIQFPLRFTLLARAQQTILYKFPLNATSKFGPIQGVIYLFYYYYFLLPLSHQSNAYNFLILHAIKLRLFFRDDFLQISRI